MANLETLELTINGSAQSASEGIDKLITSLSSLSEALVKPFSDLVDFNNELKKLKEYSRGFKIPNIAEMTGGAGATRASRSASSRSKTANAMSVSQEDAKEFAKMASSKDILEFKQAQALADLQKELSKGAEASGSRIATLTERYNKLTDSINESAKAAKLAAGSYVGGDPKIPMKSDEQWQKEYEANHAKRRAEVEAIRKSNAEYRAAQAERARIEAEEAKSRGSEALRMSTTADKAELLQMKLNAMGNAYIQNAAAGKLNNQQLAEGALKIKAVQRELEKLQNTSAGTESTLGKVKQGFSQFTGGITKFFSRIKRIATTMLIRSAIRGLIKAMKEGVNNVYEWSKTVNGTFAQSMKEAKAATLTLKNSLGAMLSPVIQALIPLFNSLTSAVITAANWINQFISLLTGQTSWTRAVETSTDTIDAMEESAKGAGGAAKEAIAAFDELNVLSTGSGGGGGGGGGKYTPDYSNMFEEVTKFDEKIRGIAEFIKENFETIKTLAIGIGAAILSWKFGKAFLDVLPTLSTIFGYVGTAATIAVTVGISYLLTSEYLDTGDPGWLFASILTTAIGSTAAWAIANKLIGGKAGTYAAAITLLLTAAADITANVQATDVSALSTESILTNAKAAIEGGLGIGLIAKAAGASLSGTLVAAGGGALLIFGVAMGLKTVFDKNNTEWDSAETITGALLAAIPVGLGLFVLGAGAIPAGVAALLTFGAVIGLKAVIPKNRIQWGEIELTDEEVQKFVEEKMFDVDVKTRMNIIASNIEVSGQEKARIAVQLDKTLGTFEIIRMGLAKAQDYTTMKSQVDALVNELTTHINTLKEQGKLTLQYTPTLVGGDETTQGEWFTNYNQGWDKIETFVKNKGELIGKWLTEQETKKIKDSVPDVISAAMEQLTAVTNAINQGMASGAALAKFEITLGELDENSAKNVLDKFNEYKKDLTDAYSKLVEDQIANQAALVEALKITIGDGYENDAEYQAALAALREMGAGAAQAVKDGVERDSASGIQMIKDWLLGGVTAGANQFDNEVVNLWVDLLESEGFSADGMKEAMETIFRDSTVDPYIIEAMQLVGFSGFEILSDDMKKKFMSVIKDFSDPSTLSELKKANVSVADIIQFSGWATLTEQQRKTLVTNMMNAYGSATTIADLKKKIPNISIGGILKMTDWQSFSDAQKTEFINALKDAFGSQEALEAAKQAGIDVGEQLFSSVESETSKTHATYIGTNKTENDKIAEKVHDNVDKIVSDKNNRHKIYLGTNKTENDGIADKVHDNVDKIVSNTNKRHKIFMGTNKTDNESIAGKVFNVVDDIVSDTKNRHKIFMGTNKTANDEIANKVNDNVEAKTKVKHAINMKSNATDIKTIGEDIDGVTGKKRTTTASMSKTSLENIAKSVTDSITGLKGSASITATIQNATSFFDTVGRGIKDSVNRFLGIKLFASGGFPTTGQLFLASEAGPELVGTIGNRTSVANNDQIVQGIASGVANANEEQNALLRRQNELLMAILQKSGNVTIGASSALGRVVNQSLQMYGNLVGG